MEVILLEKIRNLGGLGDKVKVRSGYGRNFLIPQGKAVPATEDNLARLEERRAELERAAAEELSQAQARAEQVRQLERLTLQVRAGEEGKLFGSIGPADIAEAIGAAGVELDKSMIDMPEGPIRTTGEHSVTVQLHSDVEVELPVLVEAQ